MAYKYLVIVESPAKAKTIEKYLGRNYKVIASKGHVRDLPKSKMGIDIDNHFEPDYITIRGQGETIREIKRLASKAQKVYLASDPDREGEAIAWHLAYILGLDLNDENRVVFNEITKDAVKEAFKAPRKIDTNLFNAQQARRVLDRLVGYSISPILWKKIKKGLSAGRVQSVALNLIIERENEIRAFKPEEYWEIGGTFLKNRRKFEASFAKLDGKKAELKTEADTKVVMDRLTSKAFNVASVTKKERLRQAPKPYTTSTLQQDAAHKINFRTRKTMMVAQQLYEGIALGKEGTVGLITYMRTDSTRVSDVAKAETSQFISETFGSEYSSHANKKVSNQKGAQDAHEAIRPSSVMRTPESIEKYLDKDQLKLYRLIWSRFVASQMTPAVLDTVRAEIEQNGVTFIANGSEVKFPGFLRVYQGDKQKDKMLPELQEGDVVKSVDIDSVQKFTAPPARYSEPSLIRTLEENGVGRPSTYAPTLQTIQSRYYVKLANKRFEPTELGEIVNDFMTTYFPKIVNVQFTAQMEHNLDEIAEGNEDWHNIIESFYQPFNDNLQTAEKEMEKIQIKDEPAGFDCDQCGSPMVIKLGRYGKFYACSNFPECHNTKPFVQEIGVKCPKCHEGDIVERKSKKNRIFYGCTRYPDCDFTSWDKPLNRECPKCHHYLVEKKVRGGKQVQCSHCDYKEE